LTCDSGRGHALIGPALYLPEACAADEEHRELASVREHPAGLEATNARKGRLPGTAGGRAVRHWAGTGAGARRPCPVSQCPLVTDLRLFPPRPGGGDHDGMTAIATSYQSLLKVRKGAVGIVDVPEFGFVAVTGTGEPGGAEFTEAVQALYSVSYGAHFRLNKLTGQAPRVMPLEGLWWVDDPAQQDIVAAVARGEVTIAGSDRGSWRWQALIMQPDPIDAELIATATAEAASKKDLPGLARLEYIRWAEGRCAQLLHIGPYAAEAPSIAALHEAIAAAGYRPRGRHHEIYLGDPRRSAPEKLRTIIRHPVEPACGLA
jgi:hypothetical protein